ncbi:pickpocket protein 28-like isoform X2 [Danaus plexippus]|uniref:pickpocket protein 28-like isoform X2 n=1 Tax=Danaus plexippus TaxID=13037 RepID=UPI002AB00DEE|nr:pickpocket protein 28-like isoform X2 [Danaus plexippus]
MKRRSRSRSVGSIKDITLEANENLSKDEEVKTKKHKLGLLKKHLIDYSANSNLHGLKYIGEKDRTLFEKIFWLLMFSCSLIFCIGKIHLIWIRWNESPVIVSFAEKSTPVWQIPFPAVTICSETKARQTIFNLTKYYHLYDDDITRLNLTKKERRLFEDVSMVCDVNVASYYGTKFSDAKETVQNIKELSPKINDTFYACVWKNSLSICLDEFLPIITEEGVCYTFNTLGAEELFRLENLNKDYDYLEYSKRNSSLWTLEDGYPADSPVETYPHRGIGFGIKSGLNIFLQSKEIDQDFLCRGPVKGFKILLHNPAELPRLSKQYFRAPLSHEVVVAVKPNMMTTSKGLKSLDSSRRQCYFPTERFLQYFKIYTQANCEIECLSNFTYARCGCVHFGMPHGPKIPVCNARKIICMSTAQMELATAEIQSHLGKDTTDNGTLGNALVSISRVSIFFKEDQFITSRRSELYGQTEFLANVGGLLGLFLGFSILSLAEILYFLTLRIWFFVESQPSKLETIP